MRVFFNPVLKNFSSKNTYDTILVIRRLFLVAFFLTAIGLVVCTKIIELALIQNKSSSSASNNISKKNDLFRGEIKDRNGKILASNIFKYKLKAYPKLIDNPENTVEALSKNIKGLNKERIIKQISNKSKYEVIILRNITAKKAKHLNNLGIPGLEFFPSIKRFYPHGNLASHLIGHTNKNLTGINGIEKTFNESLSSGEDVTLGMDIRIQHAIREELSNDFKTFKSKTAATILIDIKTNEIISMVSLPDFNPNFSINPRLNSYRNSATLNLYEMGSTFKVFTIAAAFENSEINLSSKFDASKPLRVSSKYLIKDYHPENRVLSTKEVFLKSSNIGASKIGLQLGGESLKNFYNNLGLFDYSSINIIEKAKPRYPLKWGDVETATLSFGHGISITPMHLVEAASLIFGNFKNGKIKLKLQNGSIENKDSLLRVSTKEKLLQLMEENVLNGTGKKAFVEGYRIGGKTATAEKINFIKGGYDKRKLVSSFLSIFPINDPQYICLVLFDEPVLEGFSNNNDGATGGKTAAKTTAKIIKRIAPILGLEIQNNIEDLLVKRKKGINFASY